MAESEMITIAKDQLRRLEERASRLAMDKSYLQLIHRLMNRISSDSGLENTIENMLRCIADVIGGDNLALYYKIDHDIFYSDVYGKNLKLGSIDDVLVQEVFQTREPVESKHDLRGATMAASELTKAYTWVYPLRVGPDIIGVFKMEGLQIAMGDLYKQLPVLFHYVALALKNEVLGHTRLQKAYNQLEQEMGVRRQAEEASRESEERFKDLFDNAPLGYHELDREGRITHVNKTELEMLGYRVEEMLGQPIWKFIADEEKSRQSILGKLAGVKPLGRNFESAFRRKEGTTVPVLIEERFLQDGAGQIMGIRSALQDITERKGLEGQLVQAQKLEAVGQLAAGIAHEINTPIQYVGDNTRFLMDAFKDITGLLEKYGQFVDAVRANSTSEEVLQEMETRKEEMDLPYLMEEVPKAIQQALEGVERVAEIVRAMKEFSHPGPKEKTPTNLNRAIENTITVSRNEWKYVAEMVTRLDPSLPWVPCLPNKFNQAILNVIINAAHAIADRAGNGSAAKGAITLSTRKEGNWAEIRVEDTGCGIPENIQSRVFDPFFTTKEVGKGTGQGLTIARSIIVDKHGRTIAFETDPGKGTTFMIRLPLGNGSGRDP